MESTPPALLPTSSLASGVPKLPAAKMAPKMADSLDPSQLQPTDGIDPNEGEQKPHHASGFWNQPWVQNILPLGTSLLLHVTIITLGIVFFGYVLPATVAPKREQVIIPDSKAIAKNETPGGIPHPGLGGDPNRDAAQDQIKDTKDDGFTANPSNAIAAAAGGGAASEESSGFLGANSVAGKGHGTGSGSGNAFGTGNGGGTAPFGVPGGGGGLLPKSGILGTGGNANKIIYLVDASGSMLGVFGALKQQLKESVNALDVTYAQQFNIVIFSDDNVFPLFKDGMQIASADNKHKAMEFIDNAVSTGGTQPLPAIKFAMAEKPELVYVLTDGFDQIANFDDVINAFKQPTEAKDVASSNEADAWVKTGHVLINCIFLQAEEDPKLVEVLTTIAKNGHGTMKTILKKDMN